MVTKHLSCSVQTQNWKHEVTGVVVVDIGDAGNVPHLSVRVICTNPTTSTDKVVDDADGVRLKVYGGECEAS